MFELVNTLMNVYWSRDLLFVKCDAIHLTKYASVSLVEVYKWIGSFSISSDFWLRWLVHEA
jgi:hypothetical protein